MTDASTETAALSEAGVQAIDAWWRAANYLSVGQIYLLDRAIRERDLDAIFIAGPGHGGPAVVASTWLEGTYSEVYPHVSRDEPGIRELFRQFSFPGGIPSHVAPETPGSIHEGGELGYALTHDRPTCTGRWLRRSTTRSTTSPRSSDRRAKRAYAGGRRGR